MAADDSSSGGTTHANVGSTGPQGASTGSSGSTSMEVTTAVSTADSSAGPGSSTHASTTGDAQREDCDAAPDAANCEAIEGLDFRCRWFTQVFPVSLGETTCALADPIGRCLPEEVFDTGCADSDVMLTCPDEHVVSTIIVQDAGNGTGLMMDGGYLLGCENVPEMWSTCSDAAPASPLCACACSPGLP